MGYCNQCGAEVDPGTLFCANCGHRLTNSGTDRDTTAHLGPEHGLAGSIDLPYMLSIERVLFMTIVSYGLYIFYWFYITWKQHRDNSGEPVYPVWHA